MMNNTTTCGHHTIYETLDVVHLDQCSIFLYVCESYYNRTQALSGRYISRRTYSSSSSLNVKHVRFSLVEKIYTLDFMMLVHNLNLCSLNFNIRDFVYMLFNISVEIREIVINWECLFMSPFRHRHWWFNTCDITHRHIPHCSWQINIFNTCFIGSVGGQFFAVDKIHER